MTTSRSMTLVLVVALLLQPIFPLMALSPVNRTRPVEAAPSVAESMSTAEDLPFSVDTGVPSTSNVAALNDKPYLPVIYKTGSAQPAASSNSPASVLPAVSASQTITNGEDIVYLVNSRQMGRTRDFSASNPGWESIISPTSSINGTTIYDFILDPNDPYHSAFVVGNTGIWRTTNLNDTWPEWQNVRSMYAITSSLPPEKYDPAAIVSRIAGDVSKPGYYFVVLGGINRANADAWVGYTFDYGNTWSWVALPSNYYGGTPFSLGTRLPGGSTGLALSQDGSGRIWVGAWPYSYAQLPRILYSEDYGRNWQVIYKPDIAPGSSFPNSLYYARGILFATMGSAVGKSLDNGQTWQFVSGGTGARTNLNYGINGSPVTDQLVYFTGSDGSLQYSTDGGVSFSAQPASPFGASASAVYAWYDDSDHMAWSGTNGFSSPGDVLFFSDNRGQSWQNKTGNWNTVFTNQWSGGDVFITLPSQVARLRDLSKRDLSKRGKETECALSCTPPVHWVNDPVDTSNGNLSYQITDLSLASLGGNLSFQRSYASADSGVARPLGYGWANNFDSRIVAPTTTPHPMTVTLQTANGSELQFFRVVSNTTIGTYAPDLGVTAALTRSVAGSVVTYTLVDKLQTTYVFTTSGALLSKRSSLGYLTTYSYTLPNTLTQVTDVGTGRWLKFTYDQGRMKTVFDHSGRTITFTYNASGDLTNLIDTRSLTWTYVYTGSHFLWKVIDPDNRTVVRTEFDAQGRAVAQYDGLDNRTVKLDFGLGSTRILTDARNFTSTDTYVGGTWIGSLDANSRPITRNYDLNFRPVYLADQNGNGAKMLWSPNGYNLERVVDAGGYTTTMRYDNLNNLTQTVDARGFTTTLTYAGAFPTRRVDALGNTWIYTPTSDGRNLLAAEEAPGKRITRYQYDSLGQRIVMTDALTNTTRFAYDALGRLITTTDALGRMTVNAYDNANNLIKVTTNYTDTSQQPNYLNVYNLITRYSYDGFGRQIAMTDTLNHVTRNYYDGAGRLISVTVNFTTASGIDPAAYNLTTWYGYDPAGNQIAITDTLNHVTRNTYDNLSRLISTTVNYTETPGLDPNVYNLTTWYQYDQVGQRTIVTDATNIATYFEYDTLGRTTATRDMPGNTMRFEYDPLGNRTVMTDANGVITRYVYDPLSRLTAVTESFTTALGLDPTRYNVATHYAYDGVGNRTIITDARGYTTTYTYDALSRILSERDALSYTTWYQYDAVGNRVVLTDAKSQVTRYTYDALDQILVISYTADSTTTRFVYDPLGNRTAMTDTTGTTTYVYDALNRPLTITSPITGVVGYRYDALGNRTRLIYPDGKVITYTFNTANRLSSTIDWSGQTTAYLYDKAGRPITTTLPNSVQSVNAYDTANRLTRLTHSRNGTTLADYQFALDKLGNRTSVTETLRQPPTQTWVRETRVFTVTQSTDDAYTTNLIWGTIDLTGNYTQMGIGTRYVEWNAGHRFPSVTLPAGAQIVGAELRFRAYADAGSIPGLWVYGEAAGTPATYTTYSDFAGRSLTSSSEQWTPGEWKQNEEYSVDVSPEVEEIAHYWSNGNAMAFQIKGQSVGSLQAWSVNGDSAKAARLILTYDYPVTITPSVTTTIQYAYDPLYRLTNAHYSSGPYSDLGYQYDQVGNRTVETRTLGGNSQVLYRSYDAANRLNGYLWDNNGSLTNNGTFTFTYNNAGRMTRAQGITATQVYTYNGDGLLMNRNSARYVWDQAAGLPQLLSDGSTLYVPGVGQWNGTSWVYALADGLGSVRQLSDASGTIVQSYTYAPFGELLAAQGTRSSALQYTGEQKDVDTGLVYLHTRWYDSATGRFTTRDPFPGFADVPQTLHPYVYALNNPVNLKDPSGEIVESPWDLFVLFIDALIYFVDAINPALDDCTRAQLLGIDLAALGIDAAALLLPGAPGGGGLGVRIFGQGARGLAQGGVQAGVRIIQVGVRGAQVGTHASAMTKGSGSRGGFVKGSSGGGGGKYSFPGPDALAKKLGVSREECHKTIKPAMKRDFWREMKAIGSTNPDIGIDVAGNIVLKHPTTGKTIETGVPLISYGR